jgi:hypothetical protein
MTWLAFGIPTEFSVGLERPLCVSFVRLVDSTVTGLGRASTDLDDYVEHWPEGRLSTYFSAVSHVEASVTALHRCLRFGEALRRRSEAPAISRTELPRNNVVDKIRNLRHAIEHADEYSLRLEGTDEPFPMLAIRDERLEVGSAVLTFKELEGAVRKVHSLATRLISVPVPTSTEEQMKALFERAARESAQRSGTASHESQVKAARRRTEP